MLSYENIYESSLFLHVSRCLCKSYRSYSIMPYKCAVYGCSNVSNRQNNISVFRIPFFNDDRAEAKKRRKRWVDIDNLTRDKWVPTSHSGVCSEHFTPESYEQRFSDFTGQSPRLLKDSFGITAFPTINKLKQPKGEQSISARDRRMVSVVFLSTLCFVG